MPQDAYTLKYVAGELGELLPGGKVSRIIQPDRDTLTLYLYTHFRTFKLDFCIFPKFRRISLTSRDKKSIDTPSPFCMLVRKHLQGAKILAAAQIPYERIVYMDFESTSEFESRTFRLYAEIMGKSSNIILTENGTILGCFKPGYAGEGLRNILKGAPYVLPVSQHKVLPDDLEGIRMALDESGPDALHEMITGIAHVTAEDIIGTYGENVTAEQVYEYLNAEKPSPCVLLDGGRITDFCARSSSPLAVPRDSILEAQQEFYDAATQEADLQARKKAYNAALAAALKRTERKIATERQRVLSCEDMEKDRLYGELITANIYRVRQGDDKLKAVNYYSDLQEEVTIPLDTQQSPAQNAQRYYRKYAKEKRTLEVSQGMLDEALSREDYLLSIRTGIDRAQDEEDLKEIGNELRECNLLHDGGTISGTQSAGKGMSKDGTTKGGAKAGGKSGSKGSAKSAKSAAKRKKAEPSQPFRMYTCGGYEILAGRSNISNDNLVKALSPDDIWLHTKEGHSCHVGILCRGAAAGNASDIPDEVLTAAAQICAFYSDLAGKSKVDVAYTKKKNLRKPKGAAPGFVTYTDYRSVVVSPDPRTELKHEP